MFSLHKNAVIASKYQAAIILKYVNIRHGIPNSFVHSQQECLKVLKFNAEVFFFFDIS